MKDEIYFFLFDEASSVSVKIVYMWQFGYKSNILLCISISLLCSKRCSAELPLRVQLICVNV